MFMQWWTYPYTWRRMAEDCGYMLGLFRSQSRFWAAVGENLLPFEDDSCGSLSVDGIDLDQRTFVESR
jgi:hypothetical protein